MPNSLMVVSCQRLGDLDVLIRSLEDDFESNSNHSDTEILEFNLQSYFSELWIGSAYEILRSIRQRTTERDPQLEALFHDLTLVRIPLEKYEIPNDQKLKKPLVLRRDPPHKDDQDIIYSKDDPGRAHIMSSGVSVRGSMMWKSFDVTKNIEIWIERRYLSDKFLEIWP